MPIYMKYDGVDGAVQSSLRGRQDLTDQLQKIDGQTKQLESSFKGKAGKACLGYWNGTGLRHSQNIIQQLEVLDEKLKEIKLLVQQNDEACAALFVIQS